MTDPLSFIVRKIALHKRASRKQTAILPLSEVRKATVYVDNFDYDADPTRQCVKNTFDALNIPVKIICPQKWDINIFGLLKPERPLDGKIPEKWDEDLFICMANDDSFAPEYASRCSTATFKVGRRQLKGDVFDLVLKDPIDKIPLQHNVFLSIMELLKKIQ